MPRKQGRQTPELNLQPELPQVVSRDFNLFYTPPKEPLPQGVEDFAKSLDNFVNKGLTESVIAGEIQEKKINSAQAEKDYNDLKLSYKDAIKEGKIDKTANPYYLEKYKELYLSDLASTFNINVSQKYGDLGIVKNPSQNAFTSFYKNQLSEFIKKNELANFDALDLEKGFFKNTSTNRNTLENLHKQNQIKLFKEKFDERLKNNVTGILLSEGKTINPISDFDENYNHWEYISNKINQQITDIVGVGNDGTATIDLVLEGIKGFAQNATTKEEVQFVKEAIPQLLKNLKAGTNSFENIGRVKTWYKKLHAELYDSYGNFKKLENNASEQSRVADSNRGYEDAENNNIQENQSTDYKLGVDKWKLNQLFDGGKTDNPEVTKQIYDLLLNGDFQQAREKVDEAFVSGQIKKESLSLFRAEIKYAQEGGKTLILNEPVISGLINSLTTEARAKATGGNTAKAVIIQNDLRKFMMDWERINRSKYIVNGQFDRPAFVSEGEKILLQRIKTIENLSEFSGLFGLSNFAKEGQDVSGSINTLIQQKQEEDRLRQEAIEKAKPKNQSVEGVKNKTDIGTEIRAVQNKISGQGQFNQEMQNAWDNRNKK